MPTHNSPFHLTNTFSKSLHHTQPPDSPPGSSQLHLPLSRVFYLYLSAAGAAAAARQEPAETMQQVTVSRGVAGIILTACLAIGVLVGLAANNNVAASRQPHSGLRGNANAEQASGFERRMLVSGNHSVVLVMRKLPRSLPREKGGDSRVYSPSCLWVARPDSPLLVMIFFVMCGGDGFMDLVFCSISFFRNLCSLRSLKRSAQGQVRSRNKYRTLQQTAWFV